MTRSTVDIRTADGVCPTSAFTPSGTGPWPAVIFYMDGPGIRPILFEMGERLAAQIKARVLVVGADNDQGFPPAQAEKLEAALRSAGVDHRVEIWPGAAHGWTMKDIPIYNEAAAERHWREMLALFDATLQAA